MSRGPLLTALGQAVEFAEVLLASAIDELEGVDSKTVHLPPICWDAVVVKQPRQLQSRVEEFRITQEQFH